MEGNETSANASTAGDTVNSALTANIIFEVQQTLVSGCPRCMGARQVVVLPAGPKQQPASPKQRSSATQILLLLHHRTLPQHTANPAGRPRWCGGRPGACPQPLSHRAQLQILILNATHLDPAQCCALAVSRPTAEAPAASTSCLSTKCSGCLAFVIVCIIFCGGLFHAGG